MEAILTIKDVAKKLQLSNGTIYKYAEKGTIPSIKIGSNRRFSEVDIENYVNQCKGQTTAKQNEAK
jgi:excisionase family DNA binding protein